MGFGKGKTFTVVTQPSGGKSPRSGKTAGKGKGKTTKRTKTKATGRRKK